MGFRWLAAAVIAGGLGAIPASADEAAEIAKLNERLSAQEQRLVSLETELAHTKAALARDLAQPMLMLVGTGPCPHGFTRIVTRVLILTRKRNAENTALFDAAGLTEEYPPGVGDNVYRDLDFCFRPANAVGID